LTGYVNLLSLEPGDELPPLEKEPVTEIQLVRYAGASGDFNPIHTVDAVAKKAGLEGVIAHGMLVMGFAAQAVTRWVPNKNLKKLRARFVSMTRPGDVITITGKVLTKGIQDGKGFITAGFWARDQKGETKLEGGFEATID